MPKPPLVDAIAIVRATINSRTHSQLICRSPERVAHLGHHDAYIPTYLRGVAHDSA